MRHLLPPVALLFAAACSSDPDPVQPGSDAGSDSPAGDGGSDATQDTSTGDDAGTAVCTLDTALSGAKFGYNYVAIDGAGTALYVASTDTPNADKFRRFTVGKGCALKLDTTFGTAGVLTNDWSGAFFGMATDKNLALYRSASNSILRIGRVWPLPVTECAPAVGESAFVVTDDGKKVYGCEVIQGDKKVIELAIGATCAAMTTATGLGVTEAFASGIAPDGTVLFATWRSTAGDAGPAGRPIVIYDPVAKAITGEFAANDFSSSSAKTIHACGADICVYDQGYRKIFRYGSNHVVKSTFDVSTVVPNGTLDVATAITSGGLAYVLYSDGSALGVVRTPIP